MHGHNWSFRFTFGAKAMDENGFVVDFGRLKFIREWLEQHLDHACMFNRDDPAKDALIAAAPAAFKVVEVENCSCEGIAVFVFSAIDALVREHTGGRVFLTEIEVVEDSRNSATYRPDRAPGPDPA